MTRYDSGRRAEWRVRDAMLRGGAAHVMRSAGSKGAADLIALYDNVTIAVQVKRAKPSQAEHDAVRDASRGNTARWALVWVNGAEWRTWCYQGGKATKLGVPGIVA